MTNGASAFGTTVIYDGKPVMELTNIGLDFGTVDDVDLTNNDSPDETEETCPGIIRVGNVDIEGNFLPNDTNGQVNVKDDLQARASSSLVIIMPAGRGMMSTTAQPKAFKNLNPSEGKAAASISFKATGKTTLHAGTGQVAAGLTTPYFALRDQGSNAVTPSPTPSGSVYTFHATLDSGDTAVAIQPTAAAGTIYVNGTLVSSGAWSSNLSVAAGEEKVIIVETRETNKASKIYRIYVKRPAA